MINTYIVLLLNFPVSYNIKNSESAAHSPISHVDANGLGAYNGQIITDYFGLFTQIHYLKKLKQFTEIWCLILTFDVAILDFSKIFLKNSQEFTKTPKYLRLNKASSQG